MSDAVRNAVRDLRAAQEAEQRANDDYKARGYLKEVEREYLHAVRVRRMREDEIIRVALETYGKESETRPLKEDEYGHYLCVASCSEQDQVIRANGVWVRTETYDQVSYLCAHLQCHENNTSR